MDQEFRSKGAGGVGSSRTRRVRVAVALGCGVPLVVIALCLLPVVGYHVIAVQATKGYVAELLVDRELQTTCQLSPWASEEARMRLMAVSGDGMVVVRDVDIVGDCGSVLAIEANLGSKGRVLVLLDKEPFVSGLSVKELMASPRRLVDVIRLAEDGPPMSDILADAYERYYEKLSASVGEQQEQPKGAQ